MSSRKPEPVDVYVGRRIRMQRMTRGLSQTELGTAVGITFQQIQKYEKGANRVSASKLTMIGSTLGVPVSFFFDGAPGQTATAKSGMPDIVADFFSQRGAAELAAHFVAMDAAQRLIVISVARGYVEAAPAKKKRAA